MNNFAVIVIDKQNVVSVDAGIAKGRFMADLWEVSVHLTVWVFYERIALTSNYSRLKLQLYLN